MSPIILYDRLASVAEDVHDLIRDVDSVNPGLALRLEALWVRMDDLVEQIPDSVAQCIGTSRLATTLPDEDDE